MLPASSFLPRGGFGPTHRRAMMRPPNSPRWHLSANNFAISKNELAHGMRFKSQRPQNLARYQAVSCAGIHQTLDLDRSTGIGRISDCDFNVRNAHYLSLFSKRAAGRSILLEA